MKKENFFKKTSTTIAFGIVALLGGFYFLGNNITGNLVRNETPKFHALSFIGLCLLACSAVLIVYSIRKK